MVNRSRARLKELLAVVLDGLRVDGAGADDGHRRLLDALSVAGYSVDELQELLTWVEVQRPSLEAGDWLSTQVVEPASGGSVRPLAEDERRYLTPAAYGYLLTLRQSGQVGWRELETLLQVASLRHQEPLDQPACEQLLAEVVFALAAGDAQEPKLDTDWAAN